MRWRAGAGVGRGQPWESPAPTPFRGALPAGLGAMIVRAQPVFEAIKWAGIAYLGYLAAHALRSAVRGRYAPLDGDGEEQGGVAVAFGGWRQGFLSNITNPKVLVFYLAVLPQFVAPAPASKWIRHHARFAPVRRAERTILTGPGKLRRMWCARLKMGAS